MPDYFTEEHFALLQELKGQKRDGSNQAQNLAYESLKTAYAVTEEWAKEVQRRCFPDGEVKLKKAPTNQANNFLSYNWARIYPSTNSPKKLAYTVGIDADSGFIVKIDTVQSPELRSAYERIQDYSAEKSPIAATLSIQDGLAKSMEELVSWTVDALTGFKFTYEEIAQKLEISLDIDDCEEILRHFDTKLAFQRFRSNWSDEWKQNFCRLARLVHNAGLDWWHVNIGVQVKFGRKERGHPAASMAVGTVQGKRERKLKWERKFGGLEIGLHILTLDLIEKIETALNEDNLNQIGARDTTRHGFWPDELEEEQTDRSETNPDEDEDDPQPDAPGKRDTFNRIYYGPPGTGKTFALQNILRNDYTDTDIDKDTDPRRYVFVTFHQSYGYEEFVEGLRPVLYMQQGPGQVQYEIRDGAFKELCKTARKNPHKQYAMIIDEINRGNISKIFGELITLIELDKRDRLSEAEPPLQVKLAYSGEKFSIPFNVDIIGTMNTADRSLALLDTALRRRFDFVAIMPDTRDVDGAPLKALFVNFDNRSIDIRRLLHTMNERIEMLYDRDHTIGHAYFTPLYNVSDGIDRFNLLSKIFRQRIIPLLEEYFFEDWSKLRIILARLSAFFARLLLSDSPKYIL